MDLVADSAEARLGRADLPTVETAAVREAVPGAARATDNIVRKVEVRAAAKEAVRAAAKMEATLRVAMARRAARPTAM